ncbi:MAG: DNA repair protein RadC [Bacilli bacterium]|nr:DNA repair protein RadC [Bacilli bacterium]
MKIKDLPIETRPREKALKYGIESLSDEELLAIILGNGTKEFNVIQLATNVLSQTGGLNGLMRSSYVSLTKIKGIKNARALSLASLITIFQRVDLKESKTPTYSINEILKKYQKSLLVDRQEKAIIVILNRFQKIIKEKVFSIGNDGGLSFSTREIFKEIYLNNGYSYYLIHTHPNASSEPSYEDIKSTRVIYQKSKKINLHLLDHFVIGLDGVTSINEFLKKKANLLLIDK